MHTTAAPCATRTKHSNQINEIDYSANKETTDEQEREREDKDVDARIVDSTVCVAADSCSPTPMLTDLSRMCSRALRLAVDSPVNLSS